MDLSNIIKGYSGVSSRRETLADTAVWYPVPTPSEEIDLVLIYNEADSDDLRVLLLDDTKEDPNRMANVAIMPGYFSLTGRTENNGWVALSADLYYWVQPLATDQNYYWATFTERMMGAAMRRTWETIHSRREAKRKKAREEARKKAEG